MCRDFWVEHRLSRLTCRMVKSGRGEVAKTFCLAHENAVREERVFEVMKSTSEFVCIEKSLEKIRNFFMHINYVRTKTL